MVKAVSEILDHVLTFLEKLGHYNGFTLIKLGFLYVFLSLLGEIALLVMDNYVNSHMPT